MLPYRLRPPNYGGKLKKEKLEEAKRKGDTRVPLSGGGPVQEAIESDLLELRKAFYHRVKKQQQQQTTATPSKAAAAAAAAVVGNQESHRHHSKTGDSFRVFQTVFSERKIALLHTKFIPSRCDRGHYSQLLYAACLSLIQRSMRDLPQSKSTSSNTTTTTPSSNCRTGENDEEQEGHQRQGEKRLIFPSAAAAAVVDDASFGLFCLYSLFETNPLPRGIQQQQQKGSKMEALSMGLHGAADNPKLRYRRSFRHPIRIDRFHYGLLLQLREEALLKRTECENFRINVLLYRLERRTTTSSTNKTGVGRGGTSNCDHDDDDLGDDDKEYQEDRCWSCGCGIAMDAIEVLGRVFPNLELCEYTGPGCLDGLAGHADYPYPCVKPNKEQQEAIERNLASYSHRGRRRMPSTASTTIGQNDDGDGEIFLITDDILETARTGNKKQQSSDSPHDVILSDLKSYTSTLQTLTIPSNLSTQKTKVFKETLEPILHSSQPTLETLLSPLLLDGEITTAKTSTTRIAGAAARHRGRRRRVTWAAIEEEEDDVDDNSNTKMGNSSGGRTNKKPGGVVRQDMSYEVLLPEEEDDDIPETLHNGIQNALHLIFRRDLPIFLPNSSRNTNENAGGEAAQQQNNTSANDMISDDVSSIGVGGVSMAQSSAATGQGGNALKSLLAKACNRSKAAAVAAAAAASLSCEGSSSTVPRRISRPQANFLTMDNFRDDHDGAVDGDDNGNESETSNLSDSDIEEEDALSVATSAVGQRALTTLLSAVSEKNGNQTTRSMRNKANGTERRKQSRKSRQDNQQQGDKRGTGDGAGADDGAESVDTSRAGKAALVKLLNEAQFADDMSPASRGASRRYKVHDNIEESSHAETSCSGQGKASLAALLHQARSQPPAQRSQNKKPSHTDDQKDASEDAVMTDADNSLVSGLRRAALSSLLKEAQSTKRQSTSRTRTQTRRSTRKKVQTRRYTAEDDSQVETNSTVSGQGKAALGNLLAQAQSSRGRQGTHTQKSIRPNTDQEPTDDASQVDGGSQVSGAGRAALASLLDQADSTEAGALSIDSLGRKQRWPRQSLEATEAENDDGSVETKQCLDDASQATSLVSGIGKAALESLLNQAQNPRPIQRRAGGDGNDKPGTRNRKRARDNVGGGTQEVLHGGQSLEQSNVRDDDDGTSFAEHKSSTTASTGNDEDLHSIHTALSGQGNFALTALLSQVDGTASPKDGTKLKSRNS